MATLVLGSVGSAIGSSLGGPVGGFIGMNIGRLAGGMADSRIFGTNKQADRHGPRMADLAVQTSTYGRVIPVLYGRMRISGNVIWSRPIKETAVTSTASSGGGKGGGGGAVSQTTVNYNYSVTLAIALCEGEIDTIIRVWADSKPLNLALGTYRFYNGSENQNPDTLIESFEGAGKTPAYRGMAYVVIEDFPLADFGNRIPNFTFEVKRKLQTSDYQGESAEQMVKEVIMIPGSGEFVYDTQVEYKIAGEQAGSVFAQNGKGSAINMHNHKGVANSLLSLDDLKQTLPNAQWVGVVVCWFGNSTDASACVLRPGVEYSTGATTEPEIWSVGSFTRTTAHAITIENNAPRYGGTPDDQSLIRYLDELRARGYKIMLYPMFFMDVSGKPWRGYLTGNASSVDSFFTKTNGYNAFITHYANLVAGKVDAFVIGSELIGLTKVSSSTGVYPAVDRLITLAAIVKGVLGASVKVTYAADWSEYHHTDGGWYNLDKLWASPNIDVVGIDAYFPLHDAPVTDYNIQTVIDGWTEGEGYNWYYTDGARTTKANLSAPYAWKNIEWWWNNQHTNPNGSVSDWVPQSKKIWFTEFGFPSVDNAINQPNVFYDHNSVNGAFPRFSRGRVDLHAQRQGIAGTLAKWKNSSIVERKFLWTWDARPYPFWPDRSDIWADGDLWKYGHWINGKFGMSSLAAIVQNICLKCGLEENDIDVTLLNQEAEGYAVLAGGSGRAALEDLMAGYFFDAVESGSILKFIPRGQAQVKSIPVDEMIPVKDSSGAKEAFTINMEHENKLPSVANVIYYNRLRNYQAGNQQVRRITSNSKQKVAIDLPIVLSDQSAKNIAERILYNAWVERTGFSFTLPSSYAALEPADVISINDDQQTHRARIVKTSLGANLELKVHAVADDISTIDFYTPPAEIAADSSITQLASITSLTMLDLPLIPGDSLYQPIIRYAVTGDSDGWSGAAIYRSSDGGSNYTLVSFVKAESVIGTAISALTAGTVYTIDRANTVNIVLQEGELESVSELALLNGANTCVIGDEIIQFQTATYVDTNKYALSNLLRGRLGTEWAVSTHSAGERFILLSPDIFKEELSHSQVGLSRLYKPVSVGATLGQTTEQSFTYQGRALKPYSPVHITGSRDGSGNLSITWVRRTRSGGDLRDGIDAALGEAKELYEIDIMNGSSVVRTIRNIAAPNVIYSSVQQVSDFGSNQSSISVRIYQISELIGRGYSGNAIV